MILGSTNGQSKGIRIEGKNANPRGSKGKKPDDLIMDEFHEKVNSGSVGEAKGLIMHHGVRPTIEDLEIAIKIENAKMAKMLLEFLGVIPDELQSSLRMLIKPEVYYISEDKCNASILKGNFSNEEPGYYIIDGCRILIDRVSMLECELTKKLYEVRQQLRVAA